MKNKRAKIKILKKTLNALKWEVKVDKYRIERFEKLLKKEEENE